MWDYYAGCASHLGRRQDKRLANGELNAVILTLLLPIIAGGLAGYGFAARKTGLSPVRQMTQGRRFKSRK